MRAIFVDRDGVICENRSDHVKSWDEFRFLPGAIKGLARLASTEFATVVVTNQAIINRGIISPNMLDAIHGRMIAEAQHAGGRIDRVLVCPHRPDERCECRKPKPGLILQAAAEMKIDLSRSYMIGDAASDLQAGLATGCTCFMVLTGRGMKQSAAAMYNTQVGFRFARDLEHAVEMILYLEAFGVAQPVPARRSVTRPLVMPHSPPSHAL